MWVHRVATLSVVCLLSLPFAVAIVTRSGLNGWYKCSDVTFSDAGNSSGMIAECAVYSAPLCYPGICETPASVDSTVDIFVKRFPATSGDPATASNVWLLQGGPGDSSTGLESIISYLHYELEGQVNVYTMDHRGTGRSTRLDCVAAQAATTGSPFGDLFDLSEVDACAQDLEYKYGNLASFSITSAATDVATFIAKFTNGKSTIVYGTSYGTALVERLMHLETPTVVGYVLDGVYTTSLAAKDKFPYFSKSQGDFGEVGGAFLDLCVNDDICNRHFTNTSLRASLQQLIKKFDMEPNSTCAQLVSTKGAQTPDPPSFSLRITLGLLMTIRTMQAAIAPVVYRLSHCAEEDVIVMTQFLTVFKALFEMKPQDEAYLSTLLYNLIVFSEMWETPAPSFEVMKKRMTDAPMFQGSFRVTTKEQYEDNYLYCAFSKEKYPTCDELKLGSNTTSAIVYDHDRYWNTTSVIPSRASVLILSSKLDAQTPHKYAEALFEGLVGSNKELVTFEYAAHGLLQSTELAEKDGIIEVCGVKLMASYVKNGGNLKRLDKTCVAEMPALNLTLPMDFLTRFFGTEDAYDGRTTRASTPPSV
ncbi:unnamed protein product [Hyaloperonospora brassicae]|uniref:AB hydrolase-1 domain-containing protein n=1 Tax=Hyaloperonospora brassicae TaxID=162125 RepID=A0AAV0TIR6_HYABA|nr:unnamed protein product [Hyaloperonospora brassicae]